MGNTIQCYGDDRADIPHKMNMTQFMFSFFHNIWNDNRHEGLKSDFTRQQCIQCSFTLVTP